MSQEPNSNPAKLTPRERHPDLPDNFELRGGQTTVGRHPSNDIVLALDSISRFHARLDSRDDYYIIQDLNSSNGSFVNGERVSQMAIHHGDLVMFGNVEFEFANDAARSSGFSTASNMVGKDIVDIRDDANERRPTTQSAIKVEEVAQKKKSSVISTVDDKKTDKATLLKLNRQLSALYRLSELVRELDVDHEEFVLQRVLDVVFQAVAADRGIFLTRIHPDSEEFDVSAVKYRDEPIVPQKVRVSRTILDQVLKDRVAILSRDAQADDRFSPSESIIATKIRSAICAPMIIGDQVLGILFIDTMQNDRQFGQEDLEFVMIVANETGVALATMRMQKEAMHRQRLAAVGETVAGISHNVKNILLLSQGGAELLTRAIDRQDLSGAKDAWTIVSRGIEKIGKLVRDMLEFSSNKHADLVDCDVNEMICATAEEVESQLITKGISLELDLDDSLGPRNLDETGLQRTLMNLIVNAMEAITHQQGEIIVTTAQRGDGTLVITIRDNGSGIPADKLARIFFPFFTTKGSSGTGLGLSMCKKCIEDLGGKISAESTENVGSTFVIEIPVAAQNHNATVDE
ncbi:ATP-binding protein [soil metagenome]